ncbi:MAG: hypothetical protein U0Q16_25715 [Bryobacteraceae bacterium]
MAAALAVALCRAAAGQEAQVAGCDGCDPLTRAEVQAKELLACRVDPPPTDPVESAISVLQSAFDAASDSSSPQVMTARANVKALLDKTIQLRDNDWKRALELASKHHGEHYEGKAADALGKFASTAPACWVKLQTLRKDIETATIESEQLLETAKEFKGDAEAASAKKGKVSAYKAARDKFTEAIDKNKDNKEAINLRQTCRKRIDDLTPDCPGWCKALIWAGVGVGGWQGYEYYQRNRTIKVGIASGATGFGAPQ